MPVITVLIYLKTHPVYYMALVYLQSTDLSLCHLFSKVKSAAEHMERRAKGGMSSEDAWNESSIELVAASAVSIVLPEVTKSVKNPRLMTLLFC